MRIANELTIPIGQKRIPTEYSMISCSCRMNREQNYYLVFHVSMSFTYYLGGGRRKKKGKAGKERKGNMFICLSPCLTPPRGSCSSVPTQLNKSKYLPACSCRLHSSHEGLASQVLLILRLSGLTSRSGYGLILIGVFL